MFLWIKYWKLPQTLILVTKKKNKRWKKNRRPKLRSGFIKFFLTSSPCELRLRLWRKTFTKNIYTFSAVCVNKQVNRPDSVHLLSNGLPYSWEKYVIYLGVWTSHVDTKIRISVRPLKVYLHQKCICEMKHIPLRIHVPVSYTHLDVYKRQG